MGITRLVARLGAAAALTCSTRAARRGEVSQREAAVFRFFNRAPDGLAGPAWVIVQAGSLAAVFGAALVARRRGGPSRPGMVLAVGTGVWLGVKVLKPIVGRGRPTQHLDDVVVRGRPQQGLGYPSGHAAVSMTLAFLVSTDGRWRIPALIVAALTGCGRMYIGAHLPLDVSGGFAAGALAGTLTSNAAAVRR